MKHVVVTGGTGGIGAGVARVLSNKGWRGTGAGLSAAEIEAYDAPPNVTCRVLNVSDQASGDALFSGLDRLDGLVNCAGILRKADEYDIDVFQQVIDVNLTGTMRCCLAAHPLLARTGGAIVNTGSMYSIFGGPHAPAYTASKGAVTQLTKALAGKWGAEGVRVNAIAPGEIETAILSPGTEKIVAELPMRRLGSTQEVAEVIYFLCSDAASYVNGTEIEINGGQHV